MLIAKIGQRVWKDRDDKFDELPDFLNGAYYFQTSVLGNKGKSWSIKVHGPSSIYIAVHEEVNVTSFENNEDGGDGSPNPEHSDGGVKGTSTTAQTKETTPKPPDTIDDEDDKRKKRAKPDYDTDAPPEKIPVNPGEDSKVTPSTSRSTATSTMISTSGSTTTSTGSAKDKEITGSSNGQTWMKISSVARTSSLNLSKIFVKNVHSEGLNTIELPEVQNEKYVASIFVTGKINIF